MKSTIFSAKKETIEKARSAAHGRPCSRHRNHAVSSILAHQPDADSYHRGLEANKRYTLSFYDAAVVQAAIDLRSNVLYSEDLQARALYGGVKVINPFA